MLSLILGILAAYVVGSIPTGYLIGKAKGLDVRQYGSKNIGFTNVKRVLGWRWGLLTLVIDFGKAGLFLWLVAPYFFASGDLFSMRIVCGLSLILGNVFSFWLKFKGGKAVATSAGVFAVIFPTGLLVSLVLFVAVLLATKYLSAGSLMAAITLLAVRIGEILIASESFFAKETLALNLLVIAATTVVVIGHRQNIKRLLSGTENKFFGAKR